MAAVLHPHYACGSENSHMYVFGGEKKAQKNIALEPTEKVLPKKKYVLKIGCGFLCVPRRCVAAY